VDDAVDIGFTLGLGLAAGLLLAGLFAAWRYGFLASALGALVVGILAGLLIRGWIGLPGAFAAERPAAPPFSSCSPRSSSRWWR